MMFCQSKSQGLNVLDNCEKELLNCVFSLLVIDIGLSHPSPNQPKIEAKVQRNTVESKYFGSVGLPLSKEAFRDGFGSVGLGLLKSSAHLPPPSSSESTFRTLGATPLLPAATANKEILSNSKRKLSNTDSARNIS